MSDIHEETHIAHLCVRHSNDYPNSPIDINRPIEQGNWWDVTIGLLVIDGQIISAEVEEVKKSP